VRRVLPYIPALLAIAGLGLLVIAAFLLDRTAGLAAGGIALILVGATLNGR
jgi:hypothetical protein